MHAHIQTLIKWKGLYRLSQDAMYDRYMLLYVSVLELVK